MLKTNKKCPSKEDVAKVVVASNLIKLILPNLRNDQDRVTLLRASEELADIEQ